MTAVRRLVTVPMAAAVAICVLACSPVLLVGGAAATLLARSDRRLRTVGLAVAYAALELRMMTKLARGGLDGDRLIDEFLITAYAAVRRIVDVEVVLDASSAQPHGVPRDEPLIVLSRHCGPGDSVLIAWLLVVRYRLTIRVVLKAILRVEPIRCRRALAAPVLRSASPQRQCPCADPQWAVRRRTPTSMVAAARTSRTAGARHIHPAAELPAPDRLSPWLEQTWAMVDAWVGDHTDDPA